MKKFFAQLRPLERRLAVGRWAGAAMVAARIARENAGLSVRRKLNFMLWASRDASLIRWLRADNDSIQRF